MKSKKIIIIIIISIIVVIVGLIFLSNYITRNPSPIPEAMKDHKNYRIVHISANDNYKTIEEYLIVGSDNKVVETREILSGYHDDEIQNAYQSALNISEITYNVELKNKNTIILNASFNNGKLADDIISMFKNSKYYTNVKIDEI